MSQKENSEPELIWKYEKKFDDIFERLRAVSRKIMLDIAKTPEGRERLHKMYEAQGTEIPIMTKADMGFPDKN